MVDLNSRLKSYITANRIPSVLIFIGETGSSRRDTAYEFVRQAVCGKEGCTCRECRAIESREYELMDVVKGKEFFGVEKARELLLTKAVPAGKKRFVVVEDLDNASKNAWNALLKILEQPPERTHFIIAASGRGVPDTIASRGVVHYFGAVTDEEIKDRIEQDPLAKLMWGKITPIDKELLLAVSEGSWGRLRSILASDAGLKTLLGIVHNFTVCKIKPEFFRQIKEYDGLEDSGAIPLESVFRVLLEGVLEDRDLVYSKRLKRNIPNLDTRAALRLVGEAARMRYQRKRVWEYLYLTTR